MALSYPKVLVDQPSSAAGATYPYDPGVDPTYDAWLAQYGYNKTKAQADDQMQWDQAQKTYDDAYGAIDRNATQGRQALQTSMLQRGVFGSGENATRSADLEGGVLRDRNTADTTLGTAYGSITKDLADAIASLDLQNQSNMAQATDRVETKKLQEGLLNQPAAAAPTVVMQAPAAAPRAAAPRAAPVAKPKPITPAQANAARASLGAGLGSAAPAPKKPLAAPYVPGKKGPQ